MRCPNCGFKHNRNDNQCQMCNEFLAKKGKRLLLTLISIFVIVAVGVSVYLASDLSDESNDDEVNHNDEANVTNIGEDVSNSTIPLFAATGPGSDIHGAIHRIEYNDNVVYLFGTMHAAAPDWFPLSDVVEDAMRRADVFVFEVDMTLETIELDEIMEIMEFYEKAMFLPDNLTLADVLSAHSYEGLLENIESFDRTYDDVRHMNPIALAMELEAEMLAEVLENQGIYYDELTGVDGYLLDFATRHQVPIIGLEPLIQQLKIAFAPDEEILNRAGFDGSLAGIMYDGFADFISKEELLEQLGEEGAVTHEDYLYNDLESLIQGLEVTDEQMENEFVRYMTEVLMNFRSTYYAQGIVDLLEETDEPTTFFVAVGI